MCTKPGISITGATKTGASRSNIPFTLTRHNIPILVIRTVPATIPATSPPLPQVRSRKHQERPIVVIVLFRKLLITHANNPVCGSTGTTASRNVVDG